MKIYVMYIRTTHVRLIPENNDLWSDSFIKWYVWIELNAGAHLLEAFLLFSPQELPVCDSFYRETFDRSLESGILSSTTDHFVYFLI